MKYTTEQLSGILEEIAEFKVELAEDPTLPSLGNRYISERVAVCRNYSNRVAYYIQVISKQAKELSVSTRQMELDLEMKVAQELSNNIAVKNQPSIGDRKALISTLLKAEYDSLTLMRVELLDIVETLKIVKMKKQDLSRTSTDIKSQRQMVRDDFDSRMGGGSGFSKPQTNTDRSIPDGMPPPVVPGKIDPLDLLDPEKRPDDMPVPVDAMHALQIAEFFGAKNHTQETPKPVPLHDDTESTPVKSIFDDI